MTMTYEVDATDPARHIYRVTLKLENLSAGLHTLTLPVWGAAYEIRDFARHVFDVRVRDEVGNLVPVDKTAKNVWSFESEVPSVTVRYNVYAEDLVVESSHMDATHAYWSGPTLFFMVDDVRDQPIDLYIRVPPGWHVSTGLDPVGDVPHHYRAFSYDHLVDCPVEAGTHRRYGFQAQGKRHEIAIWGHGNEDPDRLVLDLRRIVDTASQMFEGLPYDHYTFLVHLTEGPGGGVEHANSTTCQMSPLSFRPWSRYKRVLSLFAHEFFHLWNVKRIRPAVLDRPDYNREVYTTLLWAMEGITSYYAPLLLCRARLYSVDDYTEALAEDIKRLELKPGRRVMSAAQASFDTWMSNYDRGPDVSNRKISYYLKGSLVGFVLDMEIRRHTVSRRSLDDVLRLLYRRYGSQGRGFPEEAFQATVEEIVGGSLGGFFARYVFGTAELPIDDALSVVGLELHRHHPRADDDPERHGGGAPAWLGVEFADPPTSRSLLTVFDPGPAAGLLYPGDEIVALDGVRVKTQQEVEERICADWRPGQQVVVHVFRRERLEAVTVPLGVAPPTKYAIRPAGRVTSSQRQAFEAWLNRPFPSSRHA
jgi:predicted metalloprotease with PDZ domain